MVASRYGNGNGSGPNWLGVIGWLFLAGISIAALSVAISNCVNLNKHEHPNAYGESSLDVAPGFMEFDVNTTCMQVSGFKTDHAKGTVVGSDYIMVSVSGIYWYHVSAKVHFSDHFFPWTPWKLMVGVDGTKKLSEGSAHDVAWWASDNESIWEWPISPYAPADMDLTNMIELHKGQKFNMFVGFPEFCRFCGLIEQDVHGPGNVTLIDARMSIRMVDEISPAMKTSVTSLLLFGLLLLV